MFRFRFPQLVVSIVALALPCLDGFVPFVRAQLVAESTAVGSDTPSVTQRQQAWLSANINQRVLLAEELGEEGGRAFAASKGWLPIYDGTAASMIHGPDQVYRAADGTVHLIEAKGGTSPLSKGYGFPQGSSEWAVESSKRVLRTASATEAERQGARAVIEAAAEGRLEVHVVRTTHTLGEPHIARLDQTMKCSEQAVNIAREAIATVATPTTKTVDHVARTSDDAVRTADDIARAGDDVLRSVDDVARASLSGSVVIARASKALVPAGIAVDAGIRVADGLETEQRFEAGDISRHERTVAHGRNAAGMVGGMAGAYGGAEAGAAGGAAIGTFLCPGIGTAIGGVVGGLAGGIGGYLAGDMVAATGAELIIDAAYAN